MFKNERIDERQFAIIKAKMSKNYQLKSLKVLRRQKDTFSKHSKIHI